MRTFLPFAPSRTTEAARLRGQRYLAAAEENDRDGLFLFNSPPSPVLLLLLHISFPPVPTSSPSQLEIFQGGDGAMQISRKCEGKEKEKQEEDGMIPICHFGSDPRSQGSIRSEEPCHGMTH